MNAQKDYRKVFSKIIQTKSMRTSNIAESGIMTIAQMKDINNIQKRKSLWGQSYPVQKMPIATGNAVIGSVRTQVPYAANRIFDVIRSMGDSQTTRDLKDAVLNSVNNIGNTHPFGSGNINIIADRAAICNVTKGAVCDDYQEMAIAEMDRTGVGVGEQVYREYYPGHSYVSVEDPANPGLRGNDLIVDPWRKMVDYRRNFNVFYKYKNNYNRYRNVPMVGNTNWLNPVPFANGAISNFLNNQGINTGNLLNDIDTYKHAHPGYTPLNAMYLM
ncbi:hypothetical protein [Phocaeicola sp.]